jgi:nitroreductase
MDFKDLIQYRESVRSYDPHRPVDKAVLQRICEAGQLAPSAANRQPWKFLIVSSEEGLQRLRPCYGKDWFQDAPHILAVVGDSTKAWVRKYDNRSFLETDLAIALDHLILAATDEGVASCWISNFNPDIVRQALNLLPEEVVYGITPLGFPRTEFQRKGKKDRKVINDIIVWL